MPLRGMTRKDWGNDRHTGNFYSHAPAGHDPIPRRVSSFCFSISTPMPLRGMTGHVQHPGPLPESNFYSHAPAGHDALDIIDNLLFIYFYSHAPAGHDILA